MGTLDRWIYNRSNAQETDLNEDIQELDTIPSLTANAAQRDWKTPSEFPYGPQQYNDFITAYG
jgi:hypothetical protein